MRKSDVIRLLLITVLINSILYTISAQTKVIGYVKTSDNNRSVSNALVSYTLMSDTNITYSTLTAANGRYEINDLVTGIEHNNNGERILVADGAVATNLLVGSGNRKVFGNVGEAGRGYVFNVLGQKVMEVKMSLDNSGLSQGEINLDNYVNGVYYFVLKGNEATGVVKLMNMKGTGIQPLNLSPTEIMKKQIIIKAESLRKFTGNAEYLVEITPTDDTNINFRAIVDTVNVTDDSNLFNHQVEELTFNNVDVTIIVRSISNNYELLAGKEIKAYVNGSTDIFVSGVTDAAGQFTIENYPLRTNLTYEIIGGEGHHGSGKHTIGLFGSVDSTRSYQRMLLPETWEDPVTGEVLNIDVDDITQWADGVDLMIATKGERRIHFDNLFSISQKNLWHQYNDEFQDRIGIHWNTIVVPYIDNFGIQIIPEQLNAYLNGTDTTNVFGVNYFKGSDFTNPIDVEQSNGDDLLFGAYVELSMTESGFNKEQGRTLGLNEVNYRTSFMNSISKPISSVDAANLNALYTFHIGRFRYGYDITNLLNIINN